LDDIAINGRTEMHVEGIVLGCVDCIGLALKRDQRWDVLNVLIKPSIPLMWVISSCVVLS
jgi:hypothetical protein